MKKYISIILLFTLVLTMIIPLNSVATVNTDAVGAIGGTIWKEFTAADMYKVSELIRAEFKRTSKLRSEMHDGKQYFNYGEPAGDLVHAWIGGAGEYNGVPHESLGCMSQDFLGGSSTCLQAFERPAQWCCILVTRAGFEKGEAYTVRDTVASMYAQAGGPNSSWGLPTSNQYWVIEDGKEILYQQFENGYARSIDGSSLSALCHFYHEWDEDYNGGYPKSGEADRPSFANVSIDPDSPAPEIDPSLPNVFVRGDIDLSDGVDVADIMMIKELIFSEKWSKAHLAIADLNGSETLDVGDIMAIKAIIMQG